MSIAAGVPMPSVYLVQDADPNALAAGRNPQHASIAVTTGLLKYLNREQQQAVIGHVMAHIRNYDIQLMTLVTTLGMGGILLAAVAGAALASRGEKKGGGILIIPQ